MENRKIEISLERSVTVGNASNQFEKTRLFVALGAEPAPGDDRKEVAAVLYRDAVAILDSQFEALSKAAGANSAAQKLATTTTAAIEANSPANAPPKPPQQTSIDVLYNCSECNSPVKNTPGNVRNQEYAKSRGYAPRCFNCNNEAREKYGKKA